MPWGLAVIKKGNLERIDRISNVLLVDTRTLSTSNRVIVIQYSIDISEYTRYLSNKCRSLVVTNSLEYRKYNGNSVSVRWPLDEFGRGGASVTWAGKSDPEHSLDMNNLTINVKYTETDGVGRTFEAKTYILIR